MLGSQTLGTNVSRSHCLNDANKDNATAQQPDSSAVKPGKVFPPFGMALLLFVARSKSLDRSRCRTSRPAWFERSAALLGILIGHMALANAVEEHGDYFAARISTQRAVVGSDGGGSAVELAARQVDVGEPHKRKTATHTTSSRGLPRREVEPLGTSEVTTSRETMGGGETTAATPRVGDESTHAHRQLTLFQCPATCFGYDCDYWSNNFGYSCATSEGYGCSCGGCDCATSAPSASPAPTSLCFDADNGATNIYGDGCDLYTSSPHNCGSLYDDSDFSSNDMCCACGGTQCPATCYGATCDYWFILTADTCAVMEGYGCDCTGCECATSAPSASPAPTSLCFDADNGATDLYGYGCDLYTSSPHLCGSLYDDSDFSSNDMCCGCGGGSASSASPTEAPTDTITVEPSVSPAPTAPLPPDLLVTGSCSPMTSSEFDHDDGVDDIYAPVGTTLDGRWFYKGQNDGIVLYFDASCDGGRSGASWIFTTTDTTISTTATSDLDADGYCFGWGSIEDEGMDPPLGTSTWFLYCDGAWATTDLGITQLETPTGTPTIASLCFDTNNGATNIYGDGCDLYTSFPHYCRRLYDDSDFSSNDMCCGCGGGSAVCFDTDNGATDRYYDGCDAYANHPSWCGVFDDDDFSSNGMCCVCGGGSSSAFPTQAPTLTNKPSTSPAPTSSPIEVTTYPQLRNPIANMSEGDELKVSLALDITFSDDISFEGDRSVLLAGDAAASRPVLSGGGENRFFQVHDGASLTLKCLALTDGFAQDGGGGFGDSTYRSGAILVRLSTLILDDCILRSCYSGDLVSPTRVAARDTRESSGLVIARRS